MPVPVLPTVSELNDTFVQTFVGTLDPSFGATSANIPEGDPVLALGFAVSAIAVQEQSAIENLYDFSRASTATGADLDSWTADFGFTRFEGSPAVGIINIPTSNGQPAPVTIPIPAGSPVSTQPIILAPSTVPSIYSFQTIGATQITAGQTSVTVQVRATQNGSNYNGIAANTPLNLGTAIPGVGQPTFTTAPSLGTDAATDPQTRTDFIDYIQSLQLGTLAAVVAAIEDAAGLSNGVNLKVYDYATNPTRAFPGQVIAVFIQTGHSGPYTGSPDDPIADDVYAAMVRTVAFGETPLVYYATQYTVSAVGVPLWSFSAQALSNAGISLAALQALMLGVIQALIPASGTALGTEVFFSQLARALLDISVETSQGTVTGIVQDVNVPALTVTTSGGSFTGATDDAVFGGTYPNPDPYGYLSMALSTPVMLGTPTQLP